MGYLESAVYAMPVHQGGSEGLPRGDLGLRLVDLDAHGDELVVVLQMGLLGLDGVQDAAQSDAPGVLGELLGAGDHVLGVHVEVAVDLFVGREGELQTRPFHQRVLAGAELEAHLYELVAVVFVGEAPPDGLLQVTELHPPRVRGIV